MVGEFGGEKYKTCKEYQPFHCEIGDYVVEL